MEVRKQVDTVVLATICEQSACEALTDRPHDFPSAASDAESEAPSPLLETAWMTVGRASIRAKELQALRLNNCPMHGSG